MTTTRPARALILLIVAVFVLGTFVLAQSGGGQAAGAQATATPVAKLTAEPARVTVRMGESVDLKITAFDAAGTPLPDAVVRVNIPRRSGAYADGKLQAFRAGQFTATAVAAGAMGAPPVTLEIPITVEWPPIATLEITAQPGRLYTGVTLEHRARGTHADGSTREDAAVAWRSSGT